LYVSTGSFSIVGQTGTDIYVTWTSPDLLVEDGTDGRPGLPGASTLLNYDNADQDGSSSSQGRYHFLTSITNTSGTFDWATITAASGVDYFSVHKDSTGGATDYSDFYNQTEVGDILTWWESDGRWVSFRITSIETAPTDMFKWGISLLSFDEFDGSGDVNPDAGNDVLHRWSRAEGISMSADDVTFSSVSCNVGTGTTTQQFKVDSDGTVDASTVTSGVYTNQYTWLNVGANTDYEVKMTKVSGLALSSGILDSWLVPSTDREWIRTAASGTWVGQLLIRNKATGAILDSITVELDNTTV
jgi:hypothetical protein